MSRLMRLCRIAPVAAFSWACLFTPSLAAFIEGSALAVAVGEAADLRKSDHNDAQVLASRCAGEGSPRASDMPGLPLATRQIVVTCETEGTGYENYLPKSFARPFVIVSILTFPLSRDAAVKDQRQRLSMLLADTMSGSAIEALGGARAEV